MTCFSIHKTISSGGLLCWAIIAQSALAASATSDALIILEADGRSFTLQHTIASDGPLVALDIPAGATTQQLSYLGPNQSLHRQNASQPDSLVQLWEGVALVRYQHHYEDELIQTGPNTYRLTIPSLPQNFAVENGDITRSSYSWVFPENFELISYSAVSEDMGRWQLQDSELAYEQTERFAVTLTIEYKMHPPTTSAMTARAFTTEEFCVPNPDNLDLCATDTDKDSIPDYRDVCLSENPIQISSNSVNLDPEMTEVQASHNVNATQETAQVYLDELIGPTVLNEQEDAENISESNWGHVFGCNDENHLTLADVQFPSGFTYLDISSRHTLDRVAEALKVTEGVFEIGAHTDNRKRADTVRYYLLLRGVNPNQIRAKGYGEKIPLYDNATIDGQRGNRRIEVMRIQ